MEQNIMPQTHPEDISEGDDITVTYTAANSRSEQIVSGIVTDVVDQFPTLDEELYYVEFRAEDVDRRDCYQGEDANRRVEFTIDEYDRLEGRNGARWNRISTVQGVENIEL